MARRNKPSSRKGKRPGPGGKSKSTASSKPRASVGEQAWFPFLLLVTAAFIAYFNACPNVLVFDDREFLAAGQFTGLGPAEFLGFFSQALWEAGGNQSNLYRPLLMVSFGLESMLFGQWYAGYHLVNVGLHVLATLLVFGFARQVFLELGQGSREYSWPVLMAALLFAVHPVLSDAVNSVFNGSEIYVVIGSAGSLWYLLRNHREAPLRAWLVLSLLYLLALLYRESAVSLPALAVLVLWMTSRDHWRIRLRKCLPVMLMLVPLGLYMGMRANALSAPDELAARAPVASAAQAFPELISSAQAASETTVKAGKRESGMLESYGLMFDSSRIAGAVKLWFDGLRMMVWPHPLSVLHGESQTPLWLALCGQLLLLSLAVFAFVRGRPAVLIGVLFFYLAILPASRIVGEGIVLPMLMERMLYLPSIGLVIALTAGLSWLAKKSSMRISVATAALAVMLMTPVTWSRNQDWSDEIRLLEGDFASTPENSQLLYSLVRAQANAGNVSRSVELCRLSSERVSAHATVGVECAKANARVGRNEEAEKLYRQALAANRGMTRTHFHLARLYVQMGRWQDAQTGFKTAIDKEKVPFLREFMSGVMLMDLYPHDRARLAEARRHIENALQLQPRMAVAREALATLDKRL